jgi:hypothetical protein
MPAKQALRRWGMPLLAVGAAAMSPHAAIAQEQENPSTPGQIPNPGTYQGSTELQRQSDESDQRQRQQQEQQQQQYQSSSPQRSAPEGYGATQQASGGVHRVPPRIAINFPAVNRGIAAMSRHDYPTALAILRPLAARGDMFGQYVMGVIYDNGRGVPENHPMALQWYQRSSAAGFSLSMRNLGTMYSNGEATGRHDYVQAYRWYALSVAHFVPGEADADRVQEMDQDLNEVSAKMTPAEIALAKRLAAQTNLPFLR